MVKIRSVVAQWHKNVPVNATGCWLNSYSIRRKEIFNIFIILFWCRGMALSSATQYAMTLEFGGKWETECFNIRFPMPNLLCAWYSVKLIKK